MKLTAPLSFQALRKRAVSRYLQLASLFKQHIESGNWPVDSQIPTVEQLAKEYGVATMTIRQALQMLEADGLIERFRAKGTFVRQQPRADIWCEVQTDWDGLLMARENATIELLGNDRNAALPANVNMIGKAAGRYRHLRRRHSRNGSAFLLADVYIDERLLPKIPKKALTTVTSMRLVSTLPGQNIVDARQIVTIGSADMEMASQLNITLGDPVARVQRIAVNQEGVMILVANGIYRGDMMKIEVKLR